VDGGGLASCCSPSVPLGGFPAGREPCPVCAMALLLLVLSARAYGHRRRCRLVRQMVEIGALRRPWAWARMRLPSIANSRLPVERSARIAHASLGSQLDVRVVHRTPWPLKDDIVLQGVAAIHADADCTVTFDRIHRMRRCNTAEEISNVLKHKLA